MTTDTGWVKVFLPWNVRPGRDSAWYERTRSSVPETEKMSPDLYMEQEYPATEEEALRPTRANAFFNQDVLIDMLQDCMEPKEVRGALVKIWKPPMAGRQYIAFADTAWGETGSYSCMPVVDYRAREQVAEIYGRPGQDELSRAIYDLCMEYNKAYLGIEANGEGQTIVGNLMDMGYGQRMYHHGENWRTDPRHRGYLTTGGLAGTRDLMLSDFRHSVDQRQLVIRCRDWVTEMMGFIRNEKGRPEAAQGGHDDHVMAGAGLLQMFGPARFHTSNPKAGKVSYAYS